MPFKYRLTINKQDGDTWVIASKKFGQDFFTPEEVETVLKPAWVVTTPLLDDPNRPCDDQIVGNTYISEQTFETREGAEAFLNYVKTATAPELVARRALIKKKMQETGTQPYDIKTEIFEIPAE